MVSGLTVSSAGICADVAVTTGAAPPTLPAFVPAEIEWASLGGGIEEGWLDVPIDYADPAGGTFRLHLARHLAESASSRIGSLFINPGGPGFGGTIHALNAEVIYGEDLVRSFDIVAWDPRGTGRSEPVIDCIDNYDDYHAGTDVTPDDDVERQQLIDVAEDFAQRCTDANEDILQFVGTNSSARDIDTIRRALGEDEVSYLGFSYGSELGATWATLFPETVRAAVLDSAAEPDKRANGAASGAGGGVRGDVGDVPRRVQRRPQLRVPQRRRRRGRVRRADVDDRRDPAANGRRPSGAHPRHGPRRRRRSAVHRRELATAR